MNKPGTIFNKAFLNSCVEEVTFDPSWKNGTGYMDGAISADVAIGELRKCRDDYGRRLILIGTRLGTVVVFDRYPDQTDGGVYVTNSPKGSIFSILLSGSSVGEDEMIRLLGPWGRVDQNLGWAIEQIAQDFEA